MENGKIISIEDRIPKLKQLRKRKANRRLISLLAAFFILVACILYFLSPLSHIRTIKVDGNRYIASEKIIKSSKLSNDTSIWNIDKKSTTALIKKYPEIDTVKISSVFPNTVKINVTEFERIAYISKDHLFYPVMENGKILPPLKKKEIPVYAPVLIDFSEGKALNKLLSELEKLPQEIRNSISEIHDDPTKTDEYHITMYMNDGFEVSATSTTLSDKMVHYPAIVSQLNKNVKGVIDLEVGSFFKAYKTPGQTDGTGDDSSGN
ncbi:cell division protein FtsQ/DivIB [Actinomycetes bacterium NPDC127524]